eukprot:TRINITY_DN778_c0_g1_i2.p1 TRINITY_DN778_c0_g1~~TRINITY_DN778_c0_g1_i2.p1  ORF type:complete len:314 (+),score=41.09 TRINITY_DN778_c0_g1_i2:1-942(+)
MDYIPHDVLKQIFSNLNISDLLACALVSKEFSLCTNDNAIWNEICRIHFSSIDWDLKAQIFIDSLSPNFRKINGYLRSSSSSISSIVSKFQSEILSRHCHIEGCFFKLLFAQHLALTSPHPHNAQKVHDQQSCTNNGSVRISIISDYPSKLIDFSLGMKFLKYKVSHAIDDDDNNNPPPPTLHPPLCDSPYLQYKNGEIYHLREYCLNEHYGSSHYEVKLMDLQIVPYKHIPFDISRDEYDKVVRRKVKEVLSVGMGPHHIYLSFFTGDHSSEFLLNEKISMLKSVGLKPDAIVGIVCINYIHYLHSPSYSFL